MKLISWNVAGRAGRTAPQAAAVLAELPDVLALQEITRSSAAEWTERLSEGADPLEHVADGTHLVSEERQYTEMIASRFPLTQIDPHGFEVKRPERVLSAVVDAPAGPVEIHTTHVPPGVSTGWEKIEHLEAVYERLAVRCEIARVLCGDFNTPRAERPDGTVITWAQDEETGESNQRPERWFRKVADPVSWDPQRWDAGERNVLEGLANFDLTDVSRPLGRFPPNEKSWYWQRRIGRRFDHVFASRLLRPTSCRYIHEWREQRLSDHSAIEVVFQPD